jgi:Ca2+-binding EF-hand superfamily protein
MNKLDKILSVVAISVVLSAVAISANAQEDLFSTLDTDADGLISPSEAKAHEFLSENFALVDADSDGYVTKEELTASGIS